MKKNHSLSPIMKKHENTLLVVGKYVPNGRMVEIIGVYYKTLSVIYQ